LIWLKVWRKEDKMTEQQKQIYVVDSQILNTIQDCARKANYSFNLNLEPIAKPDYFEKGDLIHQMLAEYYKLRKYRSNWAINKKTHADIVAICIIIGRKAAVSMSLDQEIVEDVIRTFQEYCTYTANDGWDNVLFVEQVASKILYEDDTRIILYQGKLDLGIGLTNCPIMPVDHKSSSRRGRPHYLSNQFRGYCWLLGVTNIIINKIGFQKTLKDNEKFERHTLSYSPDLIDEWREVTIYEILRYITDAENNFFPPNFTSCDKYSGCIYEEVCRKPKEIRNYKLTQLFMERKEKWDPGAHMT